MTEPRYDIAPSLQFHVEAPRENLPDNFLSTEYLNTVTQTYPNNVPNRYERREKELKGIKAWVRNHNLGLGGEVSIATDREYAFDVTAAALKSSPKYSHEHLHVDQPMDGVVMVTFLGHRSHDVIDVKRHFEHSTGSGAPAASELINLETPPELLFVVGERAVRYAEASTTWFTAGVSPWRSIQNKRRFERMRTDAVSALVELRQEVETSPSVLIRDVSGPMSAPAMPEADPVISDLYNHYLRRIGYRWYANTEGGVGRVPEVIHGVIRHETDPSNVEQYKDIFLTLERYTDEMISRWSYWEVENTKPGKKKTKKWIKQERRTYVRNITQTVEQLVRLGFESFRASHRPIIGLEVDTSRPDWLSRLDIDNVPMEPDDNEDERLHDIWRIRHEMVKYFLSSKHYFTDEQLSAYVDKTYDAIQHQLRLVQHHPEYVVNSEATIRDLRIGPLKDVMIDYLHKNLDNT